MATLQFDRGRVDALRVALGASLDELRAIRSSDAEAAETMRMLNVHCRALADVWLPRVHDILSSTAMTSCTRSAVGEIDVSQATLHTRTRPGWEIRTDPLVVYGPPAPHRLRTFDDVLSDVRSGTLAPMAAPVDAHGRAGAHYTSLAFAPGEIREVGMLDVTSSTAKILDFLSDGAPLGWREHETVTIYYVTNARVMSSVHTLNAYDRDDGPDTLVDLTREATVSGYLVVRQRSSDAEVSMAIGQGDPTQSQAIATQSISAFSGAFYPDDEPEFHPIPDEPRVVIPERWTFTTSSAPMVEGWGTWET